MTESLNKIDEIRTAIKHLIVSGFPFEDKIGKLAKDEQWPNLRKVLAMPWLTAWKDLEHLIDPEWNPSDPQNIIAPYTPPPGVAFPPSGASPDMIKDPEVRADYKKYLKNKERISAKNYEQRKLIKLKQEYAEKMEYYIIGIYSFPPSDLEELKRLLDEYISDTAKKARILTTVNNNIR